MVTLNGEDANYYPLLKAMLNHGMDCARINCAHDHPETWRVMVENIRRARRETGRHCRILMDLGGPKLRTGPIDSGPMAQKWRPERDIYGSVIAPAVIWIHPEQSPDALPADVQVSLPVVGDWLEKASVNDVIEFTDARGAQRCLTLLSQVGKGFLAESARTAYLKPGLELHLVRTTSSGKPRKMDATGKVADLPPTATAIRLKVGDSLILTRKQAPGQPAQYDAKGRLVRPAVIACTLPGMFSSVKKGERILIDDGRIGGVIQSASSSELLVEITQARETGEKLLADKGINLPDTRFDMAGLTGQDIEHLDFVVRHADMVGLSFAHKAADVEALQSQLKRLGAEDMGIVLKVENRMAFERLPELLFSLLKSPVVGVMIARGDLAVECGYERLAELQEEILWLAEAAHLPVIWATQVLEGLAKNGKPSRAEITDAAMGERAECVMLNKGPHILEAIQVLNDILQRMQGHQMKKSALLRRLHW
jgi:pyruvate kinase